MPVQPERLAVQAELGLKRRLGEWAYLVTLLEAQATVLEEENAALRRELARRDAAVEAAETAAA